MPDQAVIPELLSHIDIFSSLEAKDLKAVADIAEVQSYKAGKIVFRQGDASENFWVVVSGVFQAYIWDELFKIERRLSTLKPGGVFGEMGVLTEEKRSAFVRADQDGEVLRFSKAAFFQMVEKHPGIGLGLARTLAHRLNAAGKAGGLKLEHLAGYKLTKEIIQLLPLPVILRHRVLPVAQSDRQITVALVDPTDSVARNTVMEFLGKFQVNWICILQPDFEKFRDQQLFDLVAPSAKTEVVRSAEITYLAVNTTASAEANSEAARTLDKMLLAAIDSGASDLHFEPGRGGVAVRGRIDGHLIELVPAITLNAYRPIVSRIKVLSDLDITETRMPQESVLRVRYGDRNVDLRISAVPTPNGESIAFRLFDPVQRRLDLNHLLVSEPIAEMVRGLFFLPMGLVLVTGPTGSGKTTTLYSGIQARQRHSPTNKVVTAEDPIEYELAGTTQVQIQPEIGLTYEKVLHSLLRQDPNISLIGELRDESSMAIAVEAALTGHLVLSTLHTNSAFESIMRIRLRGIEPYAIAAAIRGVISQRLVSRLCSACAEETSADAALLAKLRAGGLVGAEESPKVWKAPGCTHCRMTGRRGRVGLYEVLYITDPLRDAIERQATLKEMQEAAPPSSFVSMKRYARIVMEKGLAAPEDLAALFPAVLTA